MNKFKKKTESGGIWLSGFDERIFFTKDRTQDYNKTHQKSSGIPAVSSDGTIPFINSKEADFFIADQMLLLTIAGVAVIMDLYKMRVKNSWILCSLLAGAGTCLWQKGFAGLIKFVPGMLMPLVVLGWLFYFRMLGPGDIKIFCALGGIMGPAKILWCIWFSFLCGAGISLAVLFCCGGIWQRMAYLAAYLMEYLRTGSTKPYYRRESTLENIHFTVPIFMSVMLYTGGLY